MGFNQNHWLQILVILSYADFSNASLQVSSFVGSTLSYAKFINAKIGCVMDAQNACVKNSAPGSLTNSKINCASFKNAYLPHVDFTGSDLDCNDNGKWTDFSGSDLRYMSLPTIQGNIKFDGAILSGTILNNQNISHATFGSSADDQLVGTLFKYNNKNGPLCTDCKINNVTFIAPNLGSMQILNGTPNNKVSVMNSYFSSNNFIGLTFQNIDFVNVVFKPLNGNTLDLTNIDFSSNTFTKVDFQADLLKCVGTKFPDKFIKPTKCQSN